MSLSKLERVERCIAKIDKLIEHMHNEFPAGDREVQPILDNLNKARMGLENLKITLEHQY